MSGKLIVIEGLDGSGKTTQFEMLLNRLTESRINVKGITFPDYTEPSSALVKMYLNGEFGDDADSINAFAASSFYTVDRYASYKRHWQKEYTEGATVLAARYTTSNAIYQMVKLEQSEWDNYLSWLEDFEYAKMGLPIPDAVIYLDVEPEISQTLLSKRYEGDENKKDIHEKNIEFLTRCREAALFAAQRLDWQIISCTRDGELLSLEDIHELIFKSIGEALLSLQ